MTGLAEGGVGHILTHGLAGGILAELQGGQFGHGFLAAGLSKAVLGRLSYEDGSAPAVMGRTTIAAVVGGTVSRITGGKFANGALTSAMAQLFNAETSAARARNNRAGSCRGETCIGYGEREVLRRTSSEPRIRWEGTENVNWLEVGIDSILEFILKRPMPSISIRTGIERGYNEYEHQVGYQEYQYVTEGLGVTNTYDIGNTIWTNETIWKTIQHDQMEFARPRRQLCVMESCGP